MDVIHTAIWVSDIARAREFFVDAVGLEEKRSFTLDGVENVYVGGEKGEIQLRHAPDQPVPNLDRSDIDHIALSVEDVDAECERLVNQTGCRVIDGPTTVDVADARIVFLEGPDGYVVEFVESLD